jgi:hypothetical protein
MEPGAGAIKVAGVASTGVALASAATGAAAANGGGEM